MQIGDLYWCDFGSQAGSDKINKERPVIVVKCEPNSTLVHVVPLTGNLNKRQNARHIRVQGFGLEKTSIALIEQVCPVDRDALRDYIDCMKGSETLEKILTSLARFFKPDAA